MSKNFKITAEREQFTAKKREQGIAGKETKIKKTEDLIIYIIYIAMSTFIKKHRTTGNNTVD